MYSSSCESCRVITCSPWEPSPEFWEPYLWQIASLLPGQQKLPGGGLPGACVSPAIPVLNSNLSRPLQSDATMLRQTNFKGHVMLVRGKIAPNFLWPAQFDETVAVEGSVMLVRGTPDACAKGSYLSVRCHSARGIPVARLCISDNNVCMMQCDCLKKLKLRVKEHTLLWVWWVSVTVWCVCGLPINLRQMCHTNLKAQTANHKNDWVWAVSDIVDLSALYYWILKQYFK